ncbi:hypothetical protein GGR52DRAFT_221186 [Hypoxylon sp. FL1284]|nr:hypothetical protein GGR52DRAFT_221186 [Hypoxylon sp. FL1284]
MRNVLLSLLPLFSGATASGTAQLLPPPFLFFPGSNLSTAAAYDHDGPLAAQDAASDVECAAASAQTTFGLRWVSYGNYTLLPGYDDGELVPAQSVVMYLGVANRAAAVDSICSFAVGGLANGKPGSWVDDTSFHPCADLRDTDGKHNFIITTSAAFSLTDRYVSVNQTWYCHDDARRLVAYTGSAHSTLDMSCDDGGEVGGYHLENCTSPNVELPVTLL